MPDSGNIVQGGLTWKVLKQVFPVAASLRREHWDLLAGTGIAEAQRNDDELFYEALLRKFRREPEFVVDLDRRFLGSKKKKEREKAFVYRAGKWLLQKVPELFEYADILDAPAGLFGEATAERDLRDIIAEMRRAERREKTRLAPLAEERWKSAGAELRALLDELDRPTPEAVGRIEAAAEALLESGREVRKLAAELERRRADLRNMLESLSGLNRAAEVLERLDTLEAAQLAELAEIALDAQSHFSAAADTETELAAREKEFEKLRSEGAPWAAVAKRAEHLAGLEAERDRRQAEVETALARMAAVSAPVRNVEPPARAGPQTRRRRGRVEGGASGAQDGRGPGGRAAKDEAAEPAKIAGPPPPPSWEGFADWCETHLGSCLALSSRARGSIKKARYEDVGLAAQCLVWLAGAYRRARLEGTGNSLQGPGRVWRPQRQERRRFVRVRMAGEAVAGRLAYQERRQYPRPGTVSAHLLLLARRR